MLRSFAQSWKKQKAAKPAKSHHRRLGVEALESRELLATNIFIDPNGGNWEEGSNWSLGHAPQGLDAIKIPELNPGAQVRLHVDPAPFPNNLFFSHLELASPLSLTGSGSIFIDTIHTYDDAHLTLSENVNLTSYNVAIGNGVFSLYDSAAANIYTRLTVSGTLSLHDSARINVRQYYTQFGTLDVHIGSGFQNSPITVGNPFFPWGFETSANLSGTLAASIEDGIEPSPGTSFAIVSIVNSSVRLNADFDYVNTPGLSPRYTPTTLFLDVRARPRPNITLTQNVGTHQLIDPKVALLDEKTLRFTYGIDGHALNTAPYVAIYLSPTRIFDPLTATNVSGLQSLPLLDDTGTSSLVVGNHRATMNLTTPMGSLLNGGDFFLLLVIDPPVPGYPSGGLISESNESDNVVVLGEVTESQYREFFGPSAPLRYLTELNSTLREFGMLTTERQSAFLSQIRVETDNLTKFSEQTYNLSINGTPVIGATVADRRADYFNKLYGGMNGNTEPGDGFSYRGGGAIHLTFRRNYRAASAYFGIDIEANPDRIRDRIPDPNNVRTGDKRNPDFDSKLALRVAGWFFKTQHSKHTRFTGIEAADMLNLTADGYNNLDSALSIRKIHSTSLEVSLSVNGKNKKTGLPNNFKERKGFHTDALRILSR